MAGASTVTRAGCYPQPVTPNTDTGKPVEMYFHLVERPNKEVWGAISFGSEPVTTTVVLPSAHLREIAEQTPEKLIEMADECDRLNSAIITPKRNASLIVPGKGN